MKAVCFYFWWGFLILVFVEVQLISEELGLKAEKVTPDMLGTAKRITVTKDDTIILDGAGDKKKIEERSEQVKFVSSTHK
jgi:chaperonin GroEL (HSP60 family)